MILNTQIRFVKELFMLHESKLGKNTWSQESTLLSEQEEPETSYVEQKLSFVLSPIPSASLYRYKK